jgi:hypothetical protein
MGNIVRMGLGLACLSVIACGTAAEDEDGFTNEGAIDPGEIPVSGASSNAGNAQPANVAKQEILAEIDAEGEIVTFLRLGEGAGATLAMTTRGSIANGSALQLQRRLEADPLGRWPRDPPAP